MHDFEIQNVTLIAAIVTQKSQIFLLTNHSFSQYSLRPFLCYMLFRERYTDNLSGSPATTKDGENKDFAQDIAEGLGLPPDTPWEKLEEEARRLMINFGIPPGSTWERVIETREELLASGALPSEINEPIPTEYLNKKFFLNLDL